MPMFRPGGVLPPICGRGGMADALVLGAVTSVKNFRLGFDQQLLVQGFPLNKAIYVQIKIRDFIALCALKSQTDKVSPRISHFSNSSFYF